MSGNFEDLENRSVKQKLCSTIIYIYWLSLHKFALFSPPSPLIQKFEFLFLPLIFLRDFGFSWISLGSLDNKEIYENCVYLTRENVTRGQFLIISIFVPIVTISFNFVSNIQEYFHG